MKTFCVVARDLQKHLELQSELDLREHIDELVIREAHNKDGEIFKIAAQECEAEFDAIREAKTLNEMREATELYRRAMYSAIEIEVTNKIQTEQQSSYEEF